MLKNILDTTLETKLLETKSLLENQLAAIDLLLETLGKTSSLKNGASPKPPEMDILEAKKQYYAKRAKPTKHFSRKEHHEILATFHKFVTNNPSAQLSTKEIRKILSKTLGKRLAPGQVASVLAKARAGGFIASTSRRIDAKTGKTVGGRGSKWIFSPGTLKGAN